MMTVDEQNAFEKHIFVKFDNSEVPVSFINPGTLKCCGFFQ